MIDLLKAIAILSVLTLHAWKDTPFYAVLIYAVPLFVFLMGYNSFGSFRRKFNGDLPFFYLGYLKDKAARFIPPLLVVAFVYALILGQNPILETRHALAGVFRMTQYTLPGPGSYFVPLITQFWFSSRYWRMRI